MDLNQHLSEAEKADILRMHGEPKIYAKLVESLAPSVFGHLEVKRGTCHCYWFVYEFYESQLLNKPLYTHYVFVSSVARPSALRQL